MYLAQWKSSRHSILYYGRLRFTLCLNQHLMGMAQTFFIQTGGEKEVRVVAYGGHRDAGEYGLLYELRLLTVRHGGFP